MNFNFSRVNVPVSEEVKTTEPIGSMYAHQKTGTKTKEQKADYLALWKISDLSQSEFCRNHEIKLSTFNNWLSKENGIQRGKESVSIVDQKQLFNESASQIAVLSENRNDESPLELKFPNGCCLQFSSQANIKRIGTIARELLCAWN